MLNPEPPPADPEQQARTDVDGHLAVHALTAGERLTAWDCYTASIDRKFQHVADIAECAVIDLENIARDHADEALDAKRIHGGLTLEQFMDGRE